MKCWKFKKCGREDGGVKMHELGVCSAYPDHSHDCWKVAGTFCGGVIQGTEAKKRQTCLTCEWYIMVNPMTGTKQEILND